MGSEQEIPDIKVVETIEAPASGDATRLIQEAIDRVAARSVGPDGFKGAVLLKKDVIIFQERYSSNPVELFSGEKVKTQKQALS